MAAEIAITLASLQRNHVRVMMRRPLFLTDRKCAGCHIKCGLAACYNWSKHGVLGTSRYLDLRFASALITYGNDEPANSCVTRVRTRSCSLVACVYARVCPPPVTNVIYVLSTTIRQQTAGTMRCVTHFSCRIMDRKNRWERRQIQVDTQSFHEFANSV